MIFISSSSTSDAARDGSGRLIEQGLLFDRLEIQVLREGVDQIFVSHRRRNRRLAAGSIGRGREQRLQLRPAAAQQQTGVARQRRLSERFDHRAPVTPAIVFRDDPEPFDAAQNHVVAAVRQALDVGHHAAAADRVHRRASLVLALPARPQQHHPNHAIAGFPVRDHFAISRLEDMQRQKHVRKEDDVRKGKEGQ